MPEETHGSAMPAMTVHAALRTSSNRAAVRMLSEVGINQAVTYVKRLGFDAAPAVPSLALGVGNVSVLSMTSAYAAFANGGRVVDPVAIRRVESHAGDVLFQNTATPRPAISEPVAFLMAQMLADVVNAGTGYRVRQVGFTQPAGGKTGTTDDFHDAWFAGFTPALAATVWLGFDQPQRIIREGFAGDLAAPIWGRFMRDATQDRPGTWLSQPADVVAIQVCKISGLLPGPRCKPMTEYFRRGTEPTHLCLAHGSIGDFLGDVGGSLGDAVVGGLRDLPERPTPPPMPVQTPAPLPPGQFLPSPPAPRPIVPASRLPLPGKTTLPAPDGRDGGDGRGRGPG
jgi:penicillin-binding protein 1A